jgi:hypothetical protein
LRSKAIDERFGVAEGFVQEAVSVVAAVTGHVHAPRGFWGRAVPYGGVVREVEPVVGVHEDEPALDACSDQCIRFEVRAASVARRKGPVFEHLVETESEQRDTERRR